MTKEPKQKRKTKSIEVWARLTPTGLRFENPASRARMALETQKVPPEGEDIKLTISFKSKSKSGEIMGFYFGGVLPLWIAHNRDLIKPKDLQKNPLFLRDLLRKKTIKKQEVDDAHDDLMKEYRPQIHKNYITGETEKGRQSLADMNGYECALYVTEVMDYIEENTGISLDVAAYKKERDTISLIIQQGPKAAKKYVEPDEDEEKPYTAFDE